MNPIAQTFTVAAKAYPNGIFLDSVDLYFRSKPDSTNLPVTVQIRPTVNGYPSGSTILPFTEVTLLPFEVTVSDTPAVASTGTNFKFNSPVYLPTGEYALVVITNDPDYEVWTAFLGGTILGTTRVVSEQPYTGVFFKSSNATAYTAIQDEDLMFRLNKCVFTTATTGTIDLVANTSSNIFFDTEYLNSQELSPSPYTSILWNDKPTANSSNTLGSYARIEANQNVTRDNRKVILATPSGENGKYYAQASLLTLDANVSPMFDITRSSVIAIQNSINNDSSNEAGTIGGSAQSRYVSRRVTLADGFDASTLHVYVTAYKPSVSNILVYAKVLNRYDPDPFDLKSWTLLTQLTSANLYSYKDSDYFEYQFAASATSDILTYTSNSVLYNTFATFAIKIVLLTSDPTRVPILQDMRAIALPVA